MRRGLEFVTRKVTDGVASHRSLPTACRSETSTPIAIGGLPATTSALMWSMLQREHPDDYAIATGVSHSVRDLVEVAFARRARLARSPSRWIPSSSRPAEVEHLIGDSTKACDELGWRPAVDFVSLVKMMVDADIERLADAPSAL